MNICFFSLVTCGHGIKGGMEIHLKLLSKGLAERGHAVTIISTLHPEGIEFEKIEGIRQYCLRNTIFGSKRKGWQIASLKKFIELDAVNKFDIICTISTAIPKKLFELAWKRKIPVAVISEGPTIMIILSEARQTLSHRRGFKNLVKTILVFFYYYFFWELLYKKYDAVIAVSESVSNDIQKWHFVKNEKIHTIYNGIETSLFCPNNVQRERVRKTFAIPNDESILLFFSFVTKQKGLHLLIKALPKILKTNNQVKLIVAGEGNYLAEAKQLVGQLGLENYVVFTGHIPREEAPDYINASEIFILPTLRQEGMPFSLLEAMSCQKPVIASKIGGITSVIDDGVNGLLVPPGNISKLIEKINFLLNNKDFADKLADSARKKVVQNFSHEKMIEETLKVFELAITRKQAQGQ
ncbi:MAG: glycosyltransferase family 4 protein [Candidatus Brocadiales bacterium]|nr:glycosyltransferase family 4 protein [Candidatus Brocadiales bacterium]